MTQSLVKTHLTVKGQYKFKVHNEREVHLELCYTTLLYISRGAVDAAVPLNTQDL